MKTCKLYLKNGQVIEVRGKGFRVEYSNMTGELVSFGWDELDADLGDILYLRCPEVASVVVCS